MTAERRPGSEAFSRLKAAVDEALGGGGRGDQDAAGDAARDDTSEEGSLAARTARWMEEWGHSTPADEAGEPSTTRENK